MKLLTRREPDHARTDVGEPEADYAGGWSTGAQANASTLIRWTAWILLFCGPVIATVAYVSAAAPAPAAQPKSAASTGTSAGSQGAAGFATLYLDAFLRAGDGDGGKLAAYYPAAAQLRLEGQSGRRHGEQLTVVRLRQSERDVWSVTVAARISEANPAPTPSPDAARRDVKAEARAASAEVVHYFQIPIATAPAEAGATGYIALGLPAEVGAPTRIEAPKLVYGPSHPALPSDPRTLAATEFLRAYLTQAGPLDRYLSPGTRLTPIVPTPYTGLAVDQIAVEGEAGEAAVTAVPGDGTRLRVLVELRGTGHDGIRVPLSYALSLTARAGRWEIASLDAAPARSAPPSVAPSS
ncbi:conjugal transfer protein [Streptomyces sp. H27-H1]|uniref:conjugal transfer protein n=1 Tax=Streptomyces sp. H27-H1 TaxID=2996461 RepID=UPI00226DE783|nr:conjugal transfer protein [Streptomyces sp. H27-H1]MCY0930995.1 conjugal transfer protein [Streptomyces sp. H27-H1]